VLARAGLPRMWRWRCLDATTMKTLTPPPKTRCANFPPAPWAWPGRCTCAYRTYPQRGDGAAAVML